MHGRAPFSGKCNPSDGSDVTTRASGSLSAARRGIIAPFVSRTAGATTGGHMATTRLGSTVRTTSSPRACTASSDGDEASPSS